MANREQYTCADMIEALHAVKGAVYLAAKKLGCSHQTVYNYIDRHPTVREVYEYYDGELVDIAELALRRAVSDGAGWAVKYTLSTKGKERGYTERQEFAGVEGKPLVVVNWDSHGTDDTD